MSNAIMAGEGNPPDWVESNFRLLMDAAPDAMLVATRAGGIVLANLQAEQMFGYPRTELIGQSIETLVPIGSRSIHSSHREDFFRDAKPRPMGMGLKLSARRKDGFEFPVEISLSPLTIDAATYVTAAIRDVTEREAAEDKIRQLNVELEKKLADLAVMNKELESFSYSISHDLRAPLRQIDRFSKILLDEARPHLSLQQGEYLQEVHNGARHLGQLVDGLLNLARLGRQALIPQLVNMDALVRSVVAEVQNDSHNVGRAIQWELDPLPSVICDTTLIRQVFRNLISNAVKFSKNRPLGVVHIGHSEDPAGPAFFVADNGTGFDMNYVHRLFGVFQRLHPQEDFEGTGVGLAIVQRIVQKHGGRVWANAEPDQGATFYFSLDPGLAAEPILDSK